MTCPSDERFPNYTDVDVGINVGINIGENETQQKIINLLYENPHYTAQQLSEQLGITKRRVESNLKTLREANLIKRVGARKNGYWVVM